MAERAGTGRRLTVVLVVLALVAAAAALVVAVASRGDVNADFVSRKGSTLRVDGAPFRFVGFNLYDAAASDVYSCSPSTRLDDAGLDRAMRTIRAAGGTVVRFWAYQSYTAGGTNFSGVDRVLAAARSNGLRVLPVLEDGPGNCSTGDPGVSLDQVDGGTWYTQGYRQPLGTAAVSYRDYVARVTRHYRDDPTVLAWSLMNEAESSRRDGQGRSVLVNFARDVAAVAHAADRRHLVTLGSQSNGAPGASGADFSAVYGLRGLDLTEVHDWGRQGGDDQPMPGAPAVGALPRPEACRAIDARLACSFALARQLGKPLVVGEAGIAATDDAGRARRAALISAKLAAAFSAGASGYLLWQLNRTNTDTYAVLVGTRDPVYSVLRRTARTWSAGP